MVRRKNTFLRTTWKEFESRDSLKRTAQKNRFTTLNRTSSSFTGTLAPSSGENEVVRKVFSVRDHFMVSLLKSSSCFRRRDCVTSEDCGDICDN